MFLGFGEIMMRVGAGGHARFRQTIPGYVEATFGGGEANVCVSLAMFGRPARYLTALPRHSISQCLVATLRGIGVQTDDILWRDEGRLGIYFVETGADQRGSTVLYDREHSAVSLAAPDEYDFAAALDGVDWVHVTGITPAISENGFLSTLELVTLAKQHGASVSCDLNFRQKLWKWKTGAPNQELATQCMSEILPHVDLVIGNEEDAAIVLGIHAEGTAVEEGRINAQAYEQVARRIVDRFGNVSKVAITLRESISADQNNWGGMLFDVAADRTYLAPLSCDGRYQPYRIHDIVDRVGGGDSFAAGLLHGLTSPEYGEPDSAIRFAVAASCLKHSIKADFNYVAKEEVAALAAGSITGRVQR